MDSVFLQIPERIHSRSEWTTFDGFCLSPDPGKNPLAERVDHDGTSLLGAFLIVSDFASHDPIHQPREKLLTSPDPACQQPDHRFSLRP